MTHVLHERGHSQSRFFLAFDMDGDELISFHEYLLVLVFLGVHVEVRCGLLPALLQVLTWDHAAKSFAKSTSHALCAQEP